VRRQDQHQDIVLGVHARGRRLEGGRQRFDGRVRAAPCVGAHDDRTGAETVRNDAGRAPRLPLEHALIAEQAEGYDRDLRTGRGRGCNGRGTKREEGGNERCRNPAEHASTNHLATQR